VQSRITVSVAQLTSTNRHGGNVATIRRAAAAAKADGADLLALPEAAGMMNRDSADARQFIVHAQHDPFITACRHWSRTMGLWIHLGSTPVRGNNGRILNHSVLIDSSGVIRASYDKIHLFDVFLEGHEPTGESHRYEPGRTAVLVDTPWGPWGLSICYDLRFPQLYRDYCLMGATVLFAPSAFTVPTGIAHWEPLLRARAIENGAWVIAAAQVGHHDDGRTTYGHSMIVSPWGNVMTDLGGNSPGQVTIALDLELVARARAQIPSLRHGRQYKMRHVMSGS